MTSRRTSARGRLLTTCVALTLAATVGPTGPVHPPASADSVPASAVEEEPTVLGVRRIGTSLRDRPIRAFHLGAPDAKVTAVVLGSMHGDEKAGTRVVNALRRGTPVKDVDLWVIPTMNPDGAARNTRGNARGVDLNRNFGHRWAPLTGRYYSGRRAWSEPESRALRRFLNEVRPRYVVSFHQPLHGVGRASERRPFQRRLARGLDLPIKAFNCSGTCHGTMTSWYNATHPGTAITVEFSRSPRSRYLETRAGRGTLHAVHGSR